MSDDFRFRPAERDDSPIIARLFQISSDGLANYIWSQLAQPGEALLAVGARRYAREGEAFSYQNCLVAERAGAVVGMLHSFEMPEPEPPAPGDAAEAPDPVLRPYGELEVPGSLYISGLALFPDHRGQGLGSRFLARADDRARRLGLPNLSLICFEQNQGALRLYRRHGYAIVDQRTIVPHPTLHATGEALLMVRELD